MTGTFIKGSALVLGLALSGFVFAAEGGNGSQYLWQSPEGKWEVTPNIGLYEKTSYKVRDATTGSDSELTRFPITVKGEYGINAMFSAGITLGVDSQKLHSKAAGSTDTKKNGMLDPVLFFKGRSNMGMGWLRYGVDLSLGLQKGKIKDNGDETISIGSTALTPFVGWEMMAGAGTFGAKLSFDLYRGEGSIDDEQSTPGTTTNYKVSGGNMFGLAAFYEMPMGMWDLGGALSYSSMSGQKAKTSGTTTSLDNDMTEIMLQVYAPVHVTEMITILPTLHYGMINYTKTAYSDKSANDIGLDVGARFQF